MLGTQFTREYTHYSHTRGDDHVEMIMNVLLRTPRLHGTITETHSNLAEREGDVTERLVTWQRAKEQVAPCPHPILPRPHPAPHPALACLGVAWGGVACPAPPCRAHCLALHTALPCPAHCPALHTVLHTAPPCSLPCTLPRPPCLCASSSGTHHVHG